jgi:hypothetical protein
MMLKGGSGIKMIKNTMKVPVIFQCVFFRDWVFA